MILPCDPKSDEAKAAKAAIEALGARVEALGADADPKPVAEELRALLATQCFALASSEPKSEPSFATALSLRTWWDAGGEDWLEHWVDVRERRRIVVPPTPRAALVAERASGHALAPLLCPAAAALGAGTCGRETAGWRKRADADLARRARAASTTEADCVAEAMKEDAEDRYGALRRCVEGLAIGRTALPLGRFRSPQDGWFFVSGGGAWRCKTLRAYDLATGAAYVASDCAHAGAGPAITVVAGRVSVAAIREAAWMLMLAGAAERDVRVDASSFDVPPEIAVERPALRLGSFGVSIGCGTGGQVRGWSWMRPDRGALRGQVAGLMRWPSGCDDAEAHAAELLAIAEEAFEPGCAPAAPPASVPWSAPGAPVGRGAPPALDDPSLAAPRAALATARATRGCVAAP